MVLKRNENLDSKFPFFTELINYSINLCSNETTRFKIDLTYKLQVKIYSISYYDNISDSWQYKEFSIAQTLSELLVIYFFFFTPFCYLIYNIVSVAYIIILIILKLHYCRSMFSDQALLLSINLRRSV